MKTLICVLILFSTSFGQNENQKLLLTGSLNDDTKIIQSNYEMNRKLEMKFQQDKKSPMLGALMSLIIPGAGEVYAEDYLKAGIFVALEAAAITTAIIYNNKGNNKTAEFEDFANQNWSAERYARWTINNLQYLNPSLNANDYAIYKQDGSVNWNELNRLERAIGSGYSHSLAPFGDQQYYEMIGKYPQFSHGWSDSNPADTDYHILSPFFTSYSLMRGKANDYYSVASTAVIIIYVNHFLSALDAAWSVSTYNKSLAVKMRVEQQNLADRIEFVPTINFSLSF